MLNRLFVLLLIALVITTAAAQDADPATCPAPDALLASITTLLTESQGMMDTMTILDALRTAISEYTIACTGLAFSSEDHGLQPVIGPINIPSGLYRATATTKGYIIVKVDVLEGECDGRFSLFSLSSGQANDGAQALFNSAGCEALISISNTREAWTLEFEKLR